MKPARCSAVQPSRRSPAGDARFLLNPAERDDWPVDNVQFHDEKDLSRPDHFGGFPSRLVLVGLTIVSN